MMAAQEVENQLTTKLVIRGLTEKETRNQWARNPLKMEAGSGNVSSKHFVLVLKVKRGRMLNSTKTDSEVTPKMTSCECKMICTLGQNEEFIILIKLLNCEDATVKQGEMFHSTMNGSKVTANQMESSACNMIPTLAQLLRTHDKMLEKPVDYEPPFFRGFTEKGTRNQWARNPLKMEAGNVSNKHFVLALKRKSVIHMTAGSYALDELFGGGIEHAAITETFKEFCFGKTQPALTMCDSTQPVDHEPPFFRGCTEKETRNRRASMKPLNMVLSGVVSNVTYVEIDGGSVNDYDDSEDDNSEDMGENEEGEDEVEGGGQDGNGDGGDDDGGDDDAGDDWIAVYIELDDRDDDDYDPYIVAGNSSLLWVGQVEYRRCENFNSIAQLEQEVTLVIQGNEYLPPHHVIHYYQRPGRRGFADMPTEYFYLIRNLDHIVVQRA